MANRKLAGAVLVIGLPIVGAAAGAMILPRLNDSGMGYDQIADALGGLMLGGVAGLVLALSLVRKVSDAALRRLALAVGIVAAGLVGVVVVRYQAAMSAARQQAQEEHERLSRNKIDAPVQGTP